MHKEPIERVVTAAERSAARLSRRKFIRWVGGGGAALAAGLRLGGWPRAAFAHDEPCGNIQTPPAPVNGPFSITVERCVPKGQCPGPTKALDEQRFGDEFCRGAAECLNGTCQNERNAPAFARKKCRGLLDKTKSKFSVENCQEIEDVRKRCPEGCVLCKCTIMVPKDGNITCECGCEPPISLGLALAGKPQCAR